MYIGKPIPPTMLINREEIVSKLVKDLSNPKIHASFALVGYRRVGKTSVLLKTKMELERRGLVVAYFDVKERATDPEGFLSDLETELITAYSNHLTTFQKVRQKAQDLRKGIVQKVSNLVSSVEDIGLEISPAGTITPKIHFGDKSEEDYARVFRSVFTTADNIAEKTGKRVVLILDEFQDIMKLKEFKGLKNILDLYRGALQRRGNVSHVISGSRVHMLRKIFEEPGSPLFQHFIPLFLGSLDESDAIKLFTMVIEQRDIGVGKETLEEAVKVAFTLVGGHPYYVIILAESWDGKMALQQAFDHLTSAPTGSLYIYANYVLSEDLGQAPGGPMLKKIVKVMAIEGQPMESSEIARRVGKTQNYLEFYMKTLLDYDVITKLRRGIYQLSDSVISLVIAKNS